MKSIVFHVLNFKSWIKLISDTVDICNLVINEFNPIFEVQKIGNEAFQNASFANASGNKDSSCHSAMVKISMIWLFKFRTW